MLLLDHRASGPVAKLAFVLALANAGCSCEGEGPTVSVYLEPAVVVAGRTTTLALVGSHTHFTDREDLLGFDDAALEARQVRVDGAEQGRVELFVGSEARAGLHDVVVRTAGRELHTSLEVRTVVPEPTLDLEPDYGFIGTETKVQLMGTDTCFDVDASSLRFFPEDGGIRVDSLVVDSLDFATAEITISQDATLGEHSAVIESPCGPVSATFSVLENLGPRIHISPDEGYRGQEVVVTVTGTDTSFTDGRTTVDAGAGIVVESVVVSSPTSLTATLTIAARAGLGARSFQTITGLAETESASFTVLGEPGAPFVRILPNHIVRGERAYLWVEGVRTAFGDPLDVAFDGPDGVEVLGAWTVGPTDAVLDVIAPADGGEGVATIELGAAGDWTGSFSVVPPTDGTVAVSPAGVAAGDSDVVITITGTGTAFRADRTEVVVAESSGISLAPVEVVSATELRVTADVSATAPAGSIEVQILGGREPIRARLDVDSAVLSVTPPALRAGPASATLVIDAGEPIALDAESTVRVLAPEVSLTEPVGGAADTVEARATTGPGARPGWSAVEIAAGSLVRAAPLAILERPAPACDPTQSTIAAGTSVPVGLLTVGAMPIDGVTAVDGPFVDFFAFLGDDLYAQVAVPSDTPPGPTGIVITTHGEVAACVVDVEAPATLPSASAVQDPIPPGGEGTVSVAGADGTTSFEVGSTVAVLPGGLGVSAGAMNVLGSEGLELVVTALDAAPTGAIPLTIVTDGLEVVRLPIFIGEPGTPTLALGSLVVRTGEVATLHAVVAGIDLAGTLDVSVDADGIAVTDHRVLSDTDLEIDLDVGPEAAEGLDWITVGDGLASASALVYVRRGAPRVVSDAVRVVRGTGPVTASWDVPLASLSPGDTVARIAPARSRVRILDATPSAPEQANVSVEALAPGTDTAAQLLFVTGDEVVAGRLDVRADGAAGLALEGSAAGDAVQGSPALFLVDEPEAASAWLDVSLDPGPVGAEILSERGASVFDGPSSRTHVWFTSKDDPYVRIGAVDGAGGAFTLTTRDLASGAATELEPNADALTAEPLGDPGARATLLELATGGADVDVLRIDPTAPAALAILSGAVGAGWWAPRLAVQRIDAGGSSVGAATIAQGAVIVLDAGTTSYFAVSAVAGSSGPCLVDARALVAVSEIAPSGAADAFVELESAGGTALDGWSLDLVDANGDVFASVDLAGALVGASGLYVVGAGGAADLVDAAIADLEAAGGGVRVLHAARTLDDVAWGSVEGAEGAPAPVAPDGGSIARPYGIDRDDNAVDFVASSPTPGAPN